MAKLFNKADKEINPATEDSLAAVAADASAKVTGLDASTTYNSADSTDPLYWVANVLNDNPIATPDLTLSDTENAIMFEATGAELGVWVAHLDGLVWRFYDYLVIPTYSAVILPCRRKSLAFGTAGGDDTLHITPLRIP